MSDEIKPNLIVLTMTFTCSSVESGLEFCNEAYENFFFAQTNPPTDVDSPIPHLIQWKMIVDGVETFSMDVTQPNG